MQKLLQNVYGSFAPSDLEPIAEGLGITKEQLINSYLQFDALSGTYESKHMPCDFLTSDGICMLGDNKPAGCRDYPFTNCPDRLESLYSVLSAVEVCPVAYEIRERLKKEYHFRR